MKKIIGNSKNKVDLLMDSETFRGLFNTRFTALGLDVNECNMALDECLNATGIACELIGLTDKQLIDLLGKQEH